MRWNVARIGSKKEKALLVLAWCCTPTQYLPWSFCSLMQCRVGNDINYVEFKFRNPWGAKP